MNLLPSLTGLTTLNLKATGISQKAISEWTDKIDAEQFSKSSLKNLNLSYNTLLGCTLSNIFSLLTLPNILSVDLDHCLLNIKQVSASVKKFPVHIFKLNYNSVCLPAMKQLLSNVPALKHLSLSGFRCFSDVNGGIAAALSNLLGGGHECNLEHLDLSYCNLTSADLDIIRPYLYRCPRLSYLSLAHNRELSSGSVVAFLSELQKNFSGSLTSLHLHGIAGLDENDEFEGTLAQVVRRKYHMQKPLQSLSYRSFLHSNLVLETWKSLFQSEPKVNQIGKDMFFNVM